MRKLINVSLLVLAISCSVYAGEVPMDGRTGEIPNDGIASTPPSKMTAEENQQVENSIMDVTVVILKNVLLLF